MGYNRGGTHGRMDSLAQHVLSHRERTSPTCSKWRTKSVAISTFHHLASTKLLEHLVASEFGAVLGFLYLSLLLLASSQYLLVIGSREITMYVLREVSVSLYLIVLFSVSVVFPIHAYIGTVSIFEGVEKNLRRRSQSSVPRWPSYQWPWMEWIHIHSWSRCLLHNSK